jgi:hypothetical protein
VALKVLSWTADDKKKKLSVQSNTALTCHCVTSMWLASLLESNEEPDMCCMKATWPGGATVPAACQHSSCTGCHVKETTASTAMVIIFKGLYTFPREHAVV